MCLKIKNILSKTALLSVVTILALGLNSVQAMDISEVPVEVLGNILKQDLSIRDLGRCVVVSKQWNKVSSDDTVWEEQARAYEGRGGKFAKIFSRFTNIYPSWKVIVRESFLEPTKFHLTLSLYDDTDVFALKFGMPTSSLFINTHSTFQQIHDEKIKNKERKNNILKRLKRNEVRWNINLDLDVYEL